jgi:hypothetical protein
LRRLWGRRWDVDADVHIRGQEKDHNNSIQIGVPTWSAMCSVWGSRETYVPSGRRDSGMTRSRVRGFRAIPDVVVLGMMSGFDMASFLCFYGREQMEKSEGAMSRCGWVAVLLVDAR